VILSIFLEGVSYANTNLGHEKVDALLYDLCSGIKEKIENNDNALLTRLDGTKTAIIFTNTNAQAIEELSQEILTQALVLLEKTDLNSSECSIKLIKISYTPQDNVLSILDKINASFNLVQKNSILSIKNEMETSSLSEQLVKRRIDEHQVSLAMQSVYDKSENTLHQEAYVRLYDEEHNIFEARDFIPIVQKLNMGIQLDKNVINHALKVSALNTTEIAINLSIDFIQDSQALAWLKERLITQGKGRVLNFEISNHALLRYITQATYLATMLRELGHNFAIDRFSIESSGNLNYLQMIQPAYLKIDSHYLMDMLKDKYGVSNPALQILTDSIDAKIIATNIENRETKEFLQSAGINYFQGSFLGEMDLV
jgi:EAL domain-containing protein (putative c-di-GMP-specific phosphodiesterase class I)